MGRRRIGRPPKAPSLVRRHRVGVSLTGAELRALKRMAAERGRPVGAVLYGFVKRALRRK